MSDKSFVNMSHYIVKALGDVDYPINKNALIELVGDQEVVVDWNQKKTIKELIEPIKISRFENAASFYCALNAVMQP